MTVRVSSKERHPFCKESQAFSQEGVFTARWPFLYQPTLHHVCLAIPPPPIRTDFTETQVACTPFTNCFLLRANVETIGKRVRLREAGWQSSGCPRRRNRNLGVSKLFYWNLMTLRFCNHFRKITCLPGAEQENLAVIHWLAVCIVNSWIMAGNRSQHLPSNPVFRSRKPARQTDSENEHEPQGDTRIFMGSASYKEWGTFPCNRFPYVLWKHKQGMLWSTHTVLVQLRMQPWFHIAVSTG